MEDTYSRNSLAGRLADQWIPIQPGNDCALIHGILNYCYNHELIDREFGENWCKGFSELEDYARQFTPAYVESVTRIPAQKIVELAELMTGSKRVSFLTFTGLEYSDSGVPCIRAFLTLVALTGDRDKKGCQRIQFPH